MIRWLLFETRVGEALLLLLERRVGLALVQANWLAEQSSGEPSTAPEVQ